MELLAHLSIVYIVGVLFIIIVNKCLNPKE